MILPLLLNFSLSETDQKALIILLILLIIALLILGLIGMAVRFTMMYQARRADTMMHDVAITHVVDNPKSFRRFGWKKNNRALYRDSLIPFLIILTAFLIWLISNLFTSNWGVNIWDEFSDLFIHVKWDNADYPADDPLWVKVFGINVLARWPESDPAFPRFIVNHIPSYLVAIITIVASIYYAVICQAYISRAFMIWRRSNSVYEKSLAGFKAAQDIEITPDHPLPPSD